MLRRATRYWNYLRQFREFSRLSGQRRDLPLRWSDRWPRLRDNTGHLPFDAHYVYHTAWAARQVAQFAPSRHVDFSSYTYFSTITSAFLPVDFFDFRPPTIELSGLTCGAADLCQLDLADGCLQSVSCMHTLEHIGLGRYGDPLNPQGDLRAMAELQRVLAPGGMLLIVVPVGKPRIQYNAHRIYSPDMIEQALPELRLESLAVLPDDHRRGLCESPELSFVLEQRYACGCFRFHRPA